jgi:hypothetical protein
MNQKLLQRLAMAHRSYLSHPDESGCSLKTLIEQTP